MRLIGHLALAATLAAVLAGTVPVEPAAARTPTSATPLPLRLEAGVHTGYAIRTDGRVVAVRTITLRGPATATTTGRRAVDGRGVYLRVGSGSLAGTWVRESSVRHVPGRVGGRSLDPPTTVRFAVDPVTAHRAYLAYRFDAAGALSATTTRTVAAGTTARADRVAVINGRRYLRLVDAPWAGWWMPASGSSALGVTCTTGSRPSPGSPIVVRSVEDARSRLALTFDMGGRLTPAVAILERLLVERACTTVFPTGAAVATAQGAAAMAIVRAHPELFEVGNHTMHHCNLRDGGGGAACPATRPSTAFVARELADAATAIRAATGQETAPYWRPPYGAVDGALRRVAADAGYPTTVMWATDTIDWRKVRDGGPTALDIARAIRTTPTGGVVLMHLGGWHTLDALPYAFDRLRADDRVPTSVSDLLD
jgi:peptidoglycan/xylan/chitin deacetylase (PgdA/CDA1 family)